MNIYTQYFTARCTLNQAQVPYVLVIESHQTIMVEEIQAVCNELGHGFHEDFAKRLFEKFGGRQTLTAHHHGTDITTIRP